MEVLLVILLSCFFLLLAMKFRCRKVCYQNCISL